MAEETTTNVVPIGGTPAPAPEPTEEDAVAAALAETEAEPAGDDQDEIEYKGEKHKVPKAVKEAYTELQKASNFKMMEAAEVRKKAEASQAQTAEIQKNYQAVMEEVAELKGIDKQLEPYMKLTPAEWMAWHEQDASAAQKAQLAVTALQNKRAQLAQSANGKLAAAQAAEANARDATLAENRKAIAAQFKDWSPAREAALKEAAVEHYKMPDQYLALVGNDPIATSVLNDAIKYRQALAKAKATVKTATTEAAPEIKPVKKVGGPAAATKDLDKMSPEEFQRFRNQQERDKRQRARG